jgi:hypothetical protein
MDEKLDLKVETIGNYLDKKKIALCITGGIAAIETPKIARHLRRYGAEVKAYVTPNALKFIGEVNDKIMMSYGAAEKGSSHIQHIDIETIDIFLPQNKLIFICYLHLNQHFILFKRMRCFLIILFFTIINE